jgi:hypothetical protein
VCPNGHDPEPFGVEPDVTKRALRSDNRKLRRRTSTLEFENKRYQGQTLRLTERVEELTTQLSGRRANRSPTRAHVQAERCGRRCRIFTLPGAICAESARSARDGAQFTPTVGYRRNVYSRSTAQVDRDGQGDSRAARWVTKGYYEGDRRRPRAALVHPTRDREPQQHRGVSDADCRGVRHRRDIPLHELRPVRVRARREMYTACYCVRRVASSRSRRASSFLRIVPRSRSRGRITSSTRLSRSRCYRRSV